jgi:hypothetical protein
MGGALQSEVMPRAKTAAQKALALDQDLGAAHVAFGFVLLFYNWDWAGAEREFKQAEMSLRAGAPSGTWEVMKIFSR